VAWLSLLLQILNWCLWFWSCSSRIQRFVQPFSLLPTLGAFLFFGRQYNCLVDDATNRRSKSTVIWPARVRDQNTSCWASVRTAWNLSSPVSASQDSRQVELFYLKKNQWGTANLHVKKFTEVESSVSCTILFSYLQKCNLTFLLTRFLISTHDTRIFILFIVQHHPRLQQCCLVCNNTARPSQALYFLQPDTNPC
jgi:hypothetical protein